MVALMNDTNHSDAVNDGTADDDYDDQQALVSLMLWVRWLDDAILNMVKYL